MRLIFTVALLTAPMTAVAQEADWSVSGRVGVVSDYRDRGYTLTDGEPTVQGEVTVAHASGLYAGLWGSGIEAYGVGADGDGARIETTLYAGWAGSLAGLDVDVGVWRNVYPDGDGVNYTEFPLEVGRTMGETTLSAGVVWAPAQTGTGDQSNTWVWTRLEHAPETWPVSVHAALGHEDGGFAPDGKTDWRVGLTAPLGDWRLGLEWVDSDTDDSAVVGSLFWTYGL